MNGLSLKYGVILCQLVWENLVSLLMFDFIDDPESKKLMIMSVTSPAPKPDDEDEAKQEAIQRRRFAKKLLDDRRAKLIEMLLSEDKY